MGHPEGFFEALSTREWAVVVWLAVFVVWALWKANLAHGLADVARALFEWRILAVFALTAIWLLLLIKLASLVGLWSTVLIKDAVIWYLISGLALGFAANDLIDGKRTLRGELNRALGVGAVMQFVLNLQTFNFIVELLLQPVVAILLCVGVVAEHQEGRAQVKTLCDWLLAIIGAGMIFATGLAVYSNRGEIDVTEEALKFAFSVWVPIMMLPLLYLLAVIMVYGVAFSFMKARSGTSLRFTARVAVIRHLGGQIREVRDFKRSESARVVSRSSSYDEMSAALRSFKDRT